MSEQVDRSRHRPSIYDVAALAGVSHMTVSRVLNDSPNLREATRERVLKAIEELHYTPSSIARALATQRARRIGVLVDGPVQYGPNSTLRAIESAARFAGYTVTAFSIGGDEDTGIDVGIMEMLTQGVEALCVIAPRASSLDVLREQRIGLPTIVIKADPDPSWHTVSVDQRAGARLAVEHLIGLGHRSIAHLTGPLEWFDAREREQGWRDSMRAAGLSVAEPVVGDWSSDLGFRVAPTFAAGDATAIFAANDQMALGLIHGLAEQGIRVPDDISVVGFDDLPDARHFLPPLTTVRQDFAELGRLAVRSILVAIDGDDEEIRHDALEPRLLIRESTAPPRQNP